jgi:hypothetical protein
MCWAEQGKSVDDALFEDLIFGLPVGQCPRKLNGAGHFGNDGEHRARADWGFSGATRAARSSVEMSKPSVNVSLIEG